MSVDCKYVPIANHVKLLYCSKVTRNIVRGGYIVQRMYNLVKYMQFLLFYFSAEGQTCPVTVTVSLMLICMQSILAVICEP